LAGVLLLWTVRSFEDLRKILLPLFGASAIAMVVGLGQTLTGVEWVHGAFLQPVGGGFHRAIGFSGFSLTFAASTMCALCLAWGYAMARPEVIRRWILPPLALLSILGTFARGIWMSIGILIPIVAWLSGGKKSRWLAVAVWMTGAIVVLAVEPLRDRAFSMFDLSRNENRLNLWRTSWAIIEANPVLGIGQDNFSVVFERYRVEGYYDTIAHPHNDYLSVLVHGGLPAFIAFLGMWGIALKRGWNCLRRRDSGGETAWVGLGATAALAGLLLSAFFQNYYGTFVNCFNWWFVTGVVLSAYHLLNKPIQSNS
jgi:O-antigen ligase